MRHLLLALVVTSLPVQAQEALEHRLRIAPEEGTTTGRLVLPRFDASHGWLDRVELEGRLELRAALAYESMIEAPCQLEVALWGSARVLGPGGVPLLQLDAEGHLARWLGAHDGLVDYDGASGGRLPDLALQAAEVHAQPGDGAWSSLMASGPVLLGLALEIGLSVEPHGALLVERRLGASLELLLRYVYTPWESLEDLLGRELGPSPRHPCEPFLDDRRRSRLA